MSAQGSLPATITLVIADSFPAEGGKAVVMLNASPDRRDVIVLHPAHATPELVGAAFELLRVTRRKGVPADRIPTLVIQGALPGEPLTGAVRARLQRAVDVLNARPRSAIGALGRGKWVEVSAASLGG